MAISRNRQLDERAGSDRHRAAAVAATLLSLAGVCGSGAWLTLARGGSTPSLGAVFAALAAPLSVAALVLISLRQRRAGYRTSSEAGASGHEAARIKAEEALRASEAKFRSVVESVAEGILILQDGKIVHANPYVLRLLGSPAERVYAASYLEIVYPEDRPMIGERYRRRLAGETTGRVSFRLRNASGQAVWVEMHSNLIDWGGRTAALALLTDLTERKRAEEDRERLEAQARQAQKLEAVGLLAGGVAHDFNNMLAVILGCAELMREEIPPGSAAEQELREITKAADSSRALTRQLLAFARKQELELRPLDLNEVVSGLEKMLHRALREDIAVELDLDPSLSLIAGDIGQIEQVVLNLAVNAQDAMPIGGRLLVRTRDIVVDDGYVRDHPGSVGGPAVMMVVSDTGVGMDRGTLERIYEPFFTTKERGKGTGLGLATVYGIVKQHHGGIWASSEPGKGSSFRIHFPAAAGSVAAEPPPAPEHRPKGKGTILVTEDQEQILALVTRVLEREGYRVLGATDAGAALRTAESHGGRIDLLLTDVVMTSLDGRELYDRLRVARPEVKVLYMSGHTPEVVADHGVPGSGAAFLPKPFAPRVLTDRVGELLAGSGSAIG